MLKKLIAVVAVVGTVMSAWALTAKEEMIVNRIMHSATVCVAGDACSGQDAPAATTVAAAARAGDQVYNTGCAACHTSGAAGAPKTGDAGAWADRQAQGIDTLVKHAYEGYKGMPAKGLCADCSEDEIRGAVDYMMSQL